LSLIEKIKAHEKEIISGKTLEGLHQCPKCQGIPQSFDSHGIRMRMFLVIKGAFVHQIESFLSRWKCPLCMSTFTYYPEFALPFKRYLKDSLLPIARNYLEEDNYTYRQVVLHEHSGAAIGYTPSQEEEHIDERQLPGSTIWRWLSFIGSLKQRLSHSLNLIREESPESTIFRKIFPVHPKKYKSEERKILLGFCQRFFAAHDEFVRLFERSIFPRFATGYL